ncbi:MAG: heavy metal translocating P-type ATPase, partial [Xanthobacteraceae bacterium]|nr:heavy metal translocating P-type ATPase [Xanthobacteraceae bacterium]
MPTKDTERLQLDLPVLLPDTPDEADACVARLITDLAAREGMARVHVEPGSGGKPCKLCIHYDPEILSLARVREIAQRAGARLTERFGHILWDADGLRHQRRARTVAARMKLMPGVVEAEVSAAGLLRLEFDRDVVSERDLLRALGHMGVILRGQTVREAVRAEERKAHGHEHSHGDHEHARAAEHGTGSERQDEARAHDHPHGGVFGENTELYFALICGALLAIGYFISLATNAPAWLP